MNNAELLRQSFAHYRQTQPHFINAGRSAYRLAVFLQNNPYKEQPWKDWWDKGYRLERRKVEGPRRTDGAATGRVQSQRPNYKDRAKPPYHSTPRPRPQQVPAPATVISVGRIARFNAKYRTTV